MDLALEAGHAPLLTHSGLGMHVEVRHGWWKKGRCVWGRNTAEVQRGGGGGVTDQCPRTPALTPPRGRGFPGSGRHRASQIGDTSALTLPPAMGNISPEGRV